MAERRRLGVLVTHPVQYFSPLFRELAVTPGVDLTVYYAHRPTPDEQGAGFGVAFTWDIDLLAGYDSHFLRNVAAKPSGQGYAGYDTPEIAEIIGRERFDSFVVMGWHAKSYWQAMRACWRTETPIMVRGDSQLGPGRPSLRTLARLFTHRRFIPRFTACLAVGIRSEAYFRFYGARRIVRSPHFIDNEYFARVAATADTESLRREWGVQPGMMVAAFVGKLIPKKRPLDLLNAVAASGSRNVHVVYVGDGELRAACERVSSTLGVPTTFAGFRNQSALPSAYAAMDVLVLPSDVRETWGLVVNEAMACGRTALVSNAAGCAPDLVRDGETGFRFDLGKLQVLGDRVAQLASDPELRHRLGANARLHVSSYSVAAAAAGVLEAAELASYHRAA